MKLENPDELMITRLSAIVVASLSLLWPLGTAHAAVREWDGDASMDNKWMTAENWAGNTAPSPGDFLLFRSSQRHPNNENNFPTSTTFGSIEFDGGGPGMGYNISGNPIALNAGLRVENNSGQAIDHTLNNSLHLNSNQTFTIINDVGILFLTGTIDLNGKGLRFDVATASEARAQGVISGAGGVIKTGAGLLMLTANNTYTSATALNAGTLQINGAQPASPVFLAAGTLKGIGTVGTLSSTGGGGPGSILISPGGSPGILTSSNIALNASTTLALELNGTTPGSGYDQLNVNGSVTLNNAALSITLDFTPALGNSFTIVNNDGVDAVAGRFSGLPQGATFFVGTTQFQINYAGGNGNDVVLTRIVSLEIERVSTNAVRLLWPTNGAAGFDLECNTNLATTNWVLASPPPTVVGAKNVVTNAFPPSHKFYRLHKQ